MTTIETPTLWDSYPNQDQTIDPVETRESHRLPVPGGTRQDTSGPAAAAATQPCSTGEARSDRDGKGGAPGVAPSHLPPDAPVRVSDPDTAAFAAAVLDAANDRQVVLEALRAMGGRGTADQVHAFLERTQPTKHWQRNAVSSRLAQLKDPKRFPDGPPVRATDERRTAPSGRPVIVFEVVR